MISYSYDTRGNRVSQNNNGVITNYTYDRNNKLKSVTSVYMGRQSMKMGIYIREGENWDSPSEYVVAFKGTDPRSWYDVQNDIEAWVGNKGADMWDVMNNSKAFVQFAEEKGVTEITYVGHSKGGGEAIAAATYTHKDAITFNAANFNFEAYGLIEADRTGSIETFYVEKEAVSYLIGESVIGNSYTLPIQKIMIDYVDGRFVVFPDYIENHSMKSMIDALKEVGY